MKKLIVLVVTLSLIIGLVACGAPSYTDGAYTGNGTQELGDIRVETEVDVTVKDGAIVGVDVTSHKVSMKGEDTASFLENAQGIIPNIIEKNTTKGVDMAAGATVSSRAILQAVDNALAE